MPKFNSMQYSGLFQTEGPRYHFSQLTPVLQKTTEILSFPELIFLALASF